MPRRYSMFALVCLLFAGMPIGAADNEPKTPAIILRIKSIDGLIDDIKYLAKLSGNEEDVKQVEGLMRSFLGEKGAEPIDPTRPIGFYGAISEDFVGSNGAFMLPVGHEKKLVELLERFNGKATKGDDGIYTISHPSVPVPVPIYMRVENKYAYVTAQNKASLNKENLLDPEKLFGGDKLKTLSISLSMDRVPGDAKDLVLGFLDARFAEEQSKTEPGITKAQQLLRAEILKELARQMTSLVKESGKLDFYVDVDQKAQELVFDLSISGRKGSKLATAITDLGRSKSLVANLPGTDPALKVLAHIAMPDKIKQALEPAIDEFIAKAVENTSDAAKREQADKFFKAVLPTLKSGELDIGFGVHGPNADKHYTAVAGLKVKDGQGIESAFKALIQSLPERDRQAFKLDADKHDGVSIHRVELQALYDEHIREIVGANPVHLAAKSDLLIVAIGPDGAKALKTALAAQPGTSPLFGLEAAMSKLVPAFAELQSVQGRKASPEKVAAVAKDAFDNMQKGDDIVRFTITGGEAFKARYTLKAAGFKFSTRIGKSYTDQAAGGGD